MPQPNLVTAPDERSRCCVLDAAGNRCSKRSRYWVGTQGIDDYTHCCAEHLASVRRDGDTVLELTRSVVAWTETTPH